MPNRNSKYTVAAGFTALISIMVLVTVGGFLRFTAIHTDVNTMAAQHFTKTNLLNAMHIAVREREISLILMVNINDRFDQDAEMLRYHQLGTYFADARTALLDLPLTDGERALLDKQSRLTLEVRPLHEHLIELAITGNFISAHGFLTRQVIPKQNEIIETVKEIYKLEDLEYQQRVTAANADYRQAYVLFMALLSLSTVGFGAMITLWCIRQIDVRKPLYSRKKNAIHWRCAVRTTGCGIGIRPVMTFFSRRAGRTCWVTKTTRLRITSTNGLNVCIPTTRKKRLQTSRLT